VGLRGGSFRAVNDASTAHVTLNQVRWTEDLTVSGKIDKPLARTGMVRAQLRLATADGLAEGLAEGLDEGPGGELVVEWPEGIAGSSADIRGALGGAVVRARTPAP